MRKNPFSSPAGVEVLVQLPATQYTFPLNVDIPIIIHVTTTSKPMKLTDKEPNDNAKHFDLFPQIPSASEVEVELDRYSYILADGHWSSSKHSASDTTTVRSGLAGFTGYSSGANRAIDTALSEFDWQPEEKDKNKGCWKRTVEWRSTLLFAGLSPTFQTDYIQTSVSLPNA